MGAPKVNGAENRPDLPALTSLRFFAAIFVVIFHYNLSHQIFPLWLSDFGYEPVTFFFILSGFVLTYANVSFFGETGFAVRKAPQRFILERVARLWPAYLVALALAAPVFVHSATPTDAILVVTMMQTWVPSAALDWNAPAWSLSNEMFFYVTFSPLLWLAQGRIAAVIGLSGAGIVGVDILRVLAVAPSPDQHNFLAYFPLLNLPQFTLGIGLGLLFGTKRLRTTTRTFLFSSALLFAMIVAKPHLPWLGISVFAIAFAGIIAGAANTTLLSNRWLVFLGNSSYAIYISHFPLWLWWDHFVKAPPALDFWLYLSAVITFSIVVQLYAEKPMRSLIIKIFARRKDLSRRDQRPIVADGSV